MSETQLTQKCTTNIVNYAKRILQKLKQNEITIEQVEWLKPAVFTNSIAWWTQRFSNWEGKINWHKIKNEKNEFM